MTVLKQNSTLTTGGNAGDTSPGFEIRYASGAAIGLQGLAFQDYLNAPIFTVPQSGNASVYGDFLRAFPSLTAALNGAAIGFDCGNPNGRNPTPIQFPEGTARSGMRVWSGTGAPTSSTIGGAATAGDTYIRRDAAVPFTGGSRTSNVVTLTGVTSGHGLVAGDKITVAAADTGYNGTFTITSVTATTVTYSQTAADDASSGAGTATARIYRCTIGGTPGTWTAVA